MSDEIAARLREYDMLDDDATVLVAVSDLRALLDERERLQNINFLLEQDCKLYATRATLAETKVVSLTQRCDDATNSAAAYSLRMHDAEAELARLRAPVEGEAGEVTSYLRERTALRYMGDCKCGQCRLVERPQLDAAADLITRQAASLREAIKEVSNIGRQLGEEQGLHDSTKARLREAVEYLQGASASIHDAMKDTSWSDGEDYVKQIDAWLAKHGGDNGQS